MGSVEGSFGAPHAPFNTGGRFDAGLRQHMLGIYRNMGIALIINAAIALAFV